MGQNQPSRLASILEHRVTSRIIVLAPFLLALPSVGSGFSSDDNIILPALDGNRIDAPADRR